MAASRRSFSNSDHQRKPPSTTLTTATIAKTAKSENRSIANIDLTFLPVPKPVDRLGIYGGKLRLPPIVPSDENNVPYLFQNVKRFLHAPCFWRAAYVGLGVDSG